MLLREADCSFHIHECTSVAVSCNFDPKLRLRSLVTRSDFVCGLFGDGISAVACRILGAALCSDVVQWRCAVRLLGAALCSDGISAVACRLLGAALCSDVSLKAT